MLVRLVGFVVLGLFTYTSASAQSALKAESVTVFDTQNISASLGVVSIADQSMPGVARLSDGGGSRPQLTMLGCKFNIVLEPNNRLLQRAAPIFSRKLTTGGDPPPGGFGRLVNPSPAGITDPLTAIACDGRFTYFVFFFRQTPAFGNMAVETLVLEYDESGRGVFEAETFDPEVEKPSVQTRDVVKAARGFYRVAFRTSEDALQAKQEQEDMTRTLLFLAPKALGIPFP